METNEKTSAFQISCSQGSSVQEEHTFYHPKWLYSSSMRNIRQQIQHCLFLWKLGLKMSSAATQGWNSENYLAIYVLPVAWQYLKEDIWRLSGKVRALQYDVSLKSGLWLGKKVNAIGKKRKIGRTPWKLLEEVNETLNLSAIVLSLATAQNRSLPTIQWLVVRHLPFTVTSYVTACWEAIFQHH